MWILAVDPRPIVAPFRRGRLVMAVRSLFQTHKRRVEVTLSVSSLPFDRVSFASQQLSRRVLILFDKPSLLTPKQHVISAWNGSSNVVGADGSPLRLGVLERPEGLRKWVVQAADTGEKTMLSMEDIRFVQTTPMPLVISTVELRSIAACLHREVQSRSGDMSLWWEELQRKGRTEVTLSETRSFLNALSPTHSRNAQLVHLHDLVSFLLLVRNTGLYFHQKSSCLFAVKEEAEVLESLESHVFSQDLPLSQLLYLLRLSHGLLLQEPQSKSASVLRAKLEMKLQHKLLNSGKDLSLPAVSELLEREGSWDPEKDALRIEALKYFALTHPEERFDSSQVDVSRDPDEKHLSQMEESAECGSMPQDAFSSVQHVPDVLHFLQFGKTPEDAFRLCVALGIFSPSDNHHRIRAEPWLHIPPSLKELARSTLIERSRTQDDLAEIRRDLRGIPVYTIDSQSTEDVDDGLSLLDMNGQQWFAVHVADVTRLMSPHSPLDLACRQRWTSVYLPECSFYMLPEDISTNAVSLSPGQENYAVSFCGRFDRDGNILEVDVFPSLIDNVIKCPYNLLDPLLENESGALTESPLLLDPQDIAHLKAMLVMARSRLLYRVRQGAVGIDLPDVEFEISPDRSHVQAFPVFHHRSPSRLLVSELMVAAGEIAAQYAHKHGLPMPYRVQEPSSDSRRPDTFLTTEALRTRMATSLSLPPAKLPFSIAEIDDYRRMILHLDSLAGMSPARISAHPFPHFSLGLAAYTRVTSPIRRYADCVGHFQLRSLWRGFPHPTFKAEEINAMWEEMLPKEIAVKKLQTQSRSFWVLRFLQQQGPQQVYSALVTTSFNSQQGLDITRLYFLDVGCRLTWRAPRPGIQKGDIVQIRVVQVSLMTGDIVMEEAQRW